MTIISAESRSASVVHKAGLDRISNIYFALIGLVAAQRNDRKANIPYKSYRSRETRQLERAHADLNRFWQHGI